MKLHVAEILHLLDQKPVLLSFGVIGTETVVDKHDKARHRWLAPLIPQIHKAEKFIFDSGQDTDARTVNAVRETAVNMLEAGLFHMPHPLMWIEDPYTTDPNDITRNFYLVRETATEIIIQFMQRFPHDVKGLPTLVMHRHPLVIDLVHPNDVFLTPTANHVDSINAKTLGEAVYSVKKLVVFLNTEDIAIERVRREHERTGGDLRRRTYPHAIVRVPLETAGGTSGGDAASGAKRRRHLVRGFVYGKNTRPVEQQRWVKPYWRGDQEIGVVPRGHYQVG